MSGAKRGGYGGGPSKRPRLDEEDEEWGTFEEQLAGMDEEMGDWPEAAASGAEGEGPTQESTTERLGCPLLGFFGI